MDSHPKCQTCLDLDAPKSILPGSLGGITLLNDIGQLENSASSGCLSCQILLRAVQAFWADLSPEQGVRLHLQRDRTPEVNLRSRDREVEVYTSREWDHGERHTWPRWLKPISLGIPYRPETSKSAASEEAFRFLETCLRTCVGTDGKASHEHHCFTGSYVPTRLVEICGNETFRIVQLPPDSGIRYTALSYCWGRGSSLKATKFNIDNLAREHSLSDLPAVLRDAIHITRRLGVSYIWIDALCILQDDASDWEVESSSMGSIYKDAYLTIAASASPDAHVPFLDRQFNTSSVHLQLETPEGSDLHIKARKRPACGVHSSYNAADPWRRRAWTLQEQLLATRLISFSTNELQWRCKTNPRCECGDLKDTVESEFPRSTLFPETHPNAFWHNVVLQYSGRDLTISTDKLPAISGLARWYQLEGIQDVYLAGLWKTSLVSDMCWHRGGGDFNGELPWVLPPAYRAPSFSWASLDEQVGYWYIEYENIALYPKAQILQAKVYHTGENSYGTVDDGFLVIEAEVLPTILERQIDSSRMENAYMLNLLGRELPFRADVDIDVVATLPYQTSRNTFGIRAGSQNYFPVESRTQGLSFTRLTHGSPQCNAWVLHLASLEDNGYDFRRFSLVLGKSLRRPGAYERLGLLIQDLDWGSDTRYAALGKRETITIV
ncbi:heterokaryon incompatibility protein-domain-containing protein [Apiospora phragmitis]|uniref:Heterokaryon incompatibility protein-domain-containing protein n=1 Tax=Apiospora phragmitis TaxID=2905665 RepID=A0ABR1X7A2_9PEZI